MIRHDAHTDYDVSRGHEPLPPNDPGLNFPLPVQGDESADWLALQMLAKIAFVFGLYFVLLRCIGMSNADVAAFLAYLFATIYGIALAVKCFTPDRGEAEWPIWILGFVVLVVVVHWLFPGSFMVPRWGEPNNPSLIPPLLMLAILVLMLVGAVAPTVKSVMLRKTRGQLVLGLVASLFGGRLAACGYSPESQFTAWSFFAGMLVLGWLLTVFVTDQYMRFEIATTPTLDMSERSLYQRLTEFLPMYQSLPGMLLLAASTWVANFVFLHELHHPWATERGLSAGGALMLIVSVVRAIVAGRGPLSPFTAAWNALTFWLTYNLQRNDNPHAFQCLPWFREPVVRFVTAGIGMTAIGVGLFHLSGVHSESSSRTVNHQPAVPMSWNKLLPQGHPSAVKSLGLRSKGFEIYQEAVTKAAAKDDAMAAKRKDATGTEMLYAAAAFFLGGPLVFLFLLAVLQGNYLAWAQAKLAEIQEAELNY